MQPERITLAEKFGAELHRLTNDIDILSTPKNRAAAACFCIAQDHHAAIVFLMKNTFYSSSFALLRVLFDSYLRGLWLKYCATEAEVSGYFHGVEPPKEMVSIIESIETFKSGALSRVKKKYWRTMCAYTHTGGLHLQHWQSEDGVEPTFSLDELEECLNCAELFGAMAGLELVQLCKSGVDGYDVLQLIQSRWS